MKIVKGQNHSSLLCLMINLGIILVVLGFSCISTAYIDPYFHYHKPLTDRFYYDMDQNKQRYINNGIIRQFDYDAIITGTSMTENFKTSELDKLFDTKAIKIPFYAAFYKEINDNLRTAFLYHPEMKLVIRCLDMGGGDGGYEFAEGQIFEEEMYPRYLYDNDIWNDYEYLFSADVIRENVFPMISARWQSSFVPGITSFDEYSRWNESVTHGVDSVMAGEEFDASVSAGAPVHITEDIADRNRKNVEENVVSLAREYPDTEFYCFFPPYSAVYWHSLYANGRIYRRLEQEQIMIEEILKCPNIHLFSFDDHVEITTDLNNYKDSLHYMGWVNDQMLQWMHDGEGLLTPENYRTHLAGILGFYQSFDFGSLLVQ